MKIYKSIFWVAAVLIGCTNNNGGSLTDTPALILPVEQSEEVLLSEITKNYQFLPLRVNWTDFPAEINKVELSKDWVLTGDLQLSKRLYAFDRETGEPFPLPIQVGDGPKEFSSISDFHVEEDTLWVLDGVKGDIFLLKLESDTIQFLNKLDFDIQAKRFAKTKDGFVFLTGGGQEKALVFTDGEGNPLSSHFDLDVGFLMSPMNSFHHRELDGEKIVLFHSIADPTIYRVDQGKLEPFKTINFGGKDLERPLLDRYPMDMAGLNEFFDSQRNEPSRFMMLEFFEESFVLVYFRKSQPRIVLSESSPFINLGMSDLKNDVTFEAQFPTVVGTSEEGFTAVLSKERLQKTSGFEESELGGMIAKNPDVEHFLFTFEIDG